MVMDRSRATAHALLIVDVQCGSVGPEAHEVDSVVANIETLLVAARRGGIAVVHVQHDEPPGAPGEPGSAEWQIDPRVLPRSGEAVFRKTHNSAFLGTGLEAHLKELGIESLIVTGIQTEYCVDTTVRVAHQLGFRVVVPADGNTTWDNGPICASRIRDLFNERIWADRFARVTTTDAVARELEESAKHRNEELT